jgi:uncharacterized protein YndB with AHSA1/START domain
MKKASNSISINAPINEVFDYTNDPANLPEIWPSLIETRDVQRSPAGEVLSYEWSYKMAGMRFSGKTEVVDIVPNELNVTRTQGGIASTVTWRFQPEDSGTKATFEAEYTVPIPLLGKLAESFIVKQNDKEAETLLANLKARMES